MIEQKRRHIIKNLKLTEISGVTIPAQSSALVTIMKSDDTLPAPAPREITVTKLSTGTKAMLAEIAASLRKSKEAEIMPNESHYETLITKIADKHDLSRNKAALKALADNPEAVADAYAKDEAEEARRQAEAINLRFE